MRIGIDLGGTKTEVIALDDAGEQRFRHRLPTPREDYQQTIETIATLVDMAEQATGQTGSVGIGIPGSLSPYTGVVKNANSTWLNGQPFDSDEIIRLVDAQDAVAELALSRYELRLAKALSHVVNILDPDVIVLGGGMSNVERLYKTVPSLMKSFVFGGECETPVRKARHGDSSGVRGAAWLWPLA
ncbi:ROK family protein [Salmonella enterica]|nr:ROK family protein [Salmonella enterica]EBQ5775268.1 ROK family protein [Salmonella enterica]EDE2045027.1 ROK family protein [Salmonella enterica]EDR8583167.1 ROK family protein [Salmonella enterica]EGP8690015.1 ROK family protein [Salmonella enterica]